MKGEAVLAYDWAECTELVSRLKRPGYGADVILDTDAYNEVDDQFALSYLLGSEMCINIKAVYAAPFFNEKVISPQEGMEKSGEEVKKLLRLLGRKDMEDRVFAGSDRYLPKEDQPVISPAALDLSVRAMCYSRDRPLYVIAIAAITNIASALLINPEIRDRIVVVWLAGNSLEWTDNYEFNMRQDIAAGRVVLGSKIPLVMIPCKGVASEFSISGPEVEHWLRGKNELCDYLADAVAEYAHRKQLLPTWSKPLWDVAAAGWIIDAKFVEDRLEYSPIPEYDHQWAINRSRHLIRYVYHINRDALLMDLIQKLTSFA